MKFQRTSTWLAFLLTSALAFPTPLLTTRGATLVNPTGSIQVIDTETNSFVPQFTASDGSGSSLSTPVIIWVALCLAAGAPIAWAGVRLGRFMTGIACGVSLSGCAWTALVNVLPNEGLSDLHLTLVVLAFFAAGFCFGLFGFARIAAIVLMGSLGGISFGIRCVLLRESGLLLDYRTHYVANWILPVALGALGGICSMVWQRWTILIGTASLGTFLTFLSVDLILYKQEGMSRGLRMIFDRNAHHMVDIVTNGYHPKLVTRILIAASLGIVPFFTVFQNLVFPKPSSGHSQTHSDMDSLVLEREHHYSSYFGETRPTPENGRGDPLGSRFSM